MQLELTIKGASAGDLAYAIDLMRERGLGTDEDLTGELIEANDLQSAQIRGLAGEVKVLRGALEETINQVRELQKQD